MRFTVQMIAGDFAGELWSTDSPDTLSEALELAMPLVPYFLSDPQAVLTITDGGWTEAPAPTITWDPVAAPLDGKQGPQ